MFSPHGASAHVVLNDRHAVRLSLCRVIPAEPRAASPPGSASPVDVGRPTVWVCSWRPGDTSQPRGSRRTWVWNRMLMGEKWDWRNDCGGDGEERVSQANGRHRSARTALPVPHPPTAPPAGSGPGQAASVSLTHRCLLLRLLELATGEPRGCGRSCAWCGGGAWMDPACPDAGRGVARGSVVGFRGGPESEPRSVRHVCSARGLGLVALAHAR